ncbi:hypothetical protein BYT27DRAFT_7260300 [Phlegmacium glaucopus]|nr:hypothetical protein BYT27DRAFT_7260300 [Phlegmacium glaucopus]
MSLADDKFLPTGTYAIINAEYDHSIAFSEQDQCLSTAGADDYSVLYLKRLLERVLIVSSYSGQSHSSRTRNGLSKVLLMYQSISVEGEDVIWAKNPPKPHQWVIKRHSEAVQLYMIYSPSQSHLFWSLPNADQGTTPQLSSDFDKRSSLWKFKKIEQPAADDDMPKATEQCATGAVHRPRELKSEIRNRFAVIIPPGWLTSITSVACGGTSNLIRIRRTVDGALETQDLVSGWDATDKLMTLDGTDSEALALPSARDSYVLVLDAFHSKNPARKDPRKLPGFKDSSSNLRVFTTSRPNDMKSFPDFQTFTIFDELPDASGSTRTQNAIITIHSSIKDAIDLNGPGRPDPESVNKGYNVELDLPRPSSMDQWLDKYRVVFIVDDSSAMAVEGAWGKARGAVIQIAAEAMQYDADGIDIYFLNSLLHREGIVARAEVVQIFGQIKPQGPSLIGARLESVLSKITLQLEQAKRNMSDYGQIRPINIVVLTNSSPSDDAAKVIRIAARKLNQGLHHPNAVGIQFIQIGNDNLVEKALQKLSQDPSFNIVDSVSFGTKFSPDNLQKAVLGVMHPSVRVKLASSSGRRLLYYRVFNTDGAIATKRPAYLDNPYLGCIMTKWVPPPHRAGSLKNCLSAMENIDPRKTRLFAMSSSKSLADDTPIPLNMSQTLGLIPAEPLVLFSEVIPQPGFKQGTESLRVSPDAQSPLEPRFLYYGVYTEGAVFASKKPIDSQEAWVSRVDLDFVLPPLSVVSLKRSIAKNEGITAITTRSQLFVNNDALTPLHDDYAVFTEDGNWPGSTVDDHVLFRFDNQYWMEFDGLKHFIQNCSTGRAIFLDADKTSYGQHLLLGTNKYKFVLTDYYQFYFKPQQSGATAFRAEATGDWAGPDFKSRTRAAAIADIKSSISSEPEPLQVFADINAECGRTEVYKIGWRKFDENDRTQMWSLLPA